LIRILTHYAHESYQQALSKIPGVEFYHVIDSTGVWPADKKPKFIWPENVSKPDNIKGIEARDIRIQDFDLVLIHWHPFIETFSNLWGDLPVIFLEHTWPKNNHPGEINHWKNVRHEFVDHTVFITLSSKKAWDYEHDENSSYIYHSIDVDAFPKKILYDSKTIMTTTNEFITRDWACGFTFWANVLGLSGKPYFPKDQIQLFGYGNDNIKPYAKGRRSREEVLDLLVNAGVYFNPSQMSPIPMSLLEAAAVGTPIVSTAKCEVGRLFKNKIHGIISDDIVELRCGIKELLNHLEHAKVMAENAREVVQVNFSPEKFQENWLKVFKKVMYDK
jgi:hypothetical protein